MRSQTSPLTGNGRTLLTGLTSLTGNGLQMADL
jgi:hypothetical protein